MRSMVERAIQQALPTALRAVPPSHKWEGKD
jgi:hypothetical protein